MKKITEIKWSRFKNDSQGQEGIKDFEFAISEECQVKDLVSLAQKYDKELFRNFSKKQISEFEDQVTYVLDLIDEYFEESKQEIESVEDLESAYIQVCFKFLLNNFEEQIAKDLGGTLPERISLDDIPQKYFKILLNWTVQFSLAFYAQGYNYFLPNLFAFQFLQLKTFAELQDIDLPKMPKETDYRARCLYYLSLCHTMVNYFYESDITDMQEASAYLFSYIFPEVLADLESAHRPLPEHPEQIWLLVGNLRGDEKTMSRGFWQGSPFMRRGDLCLFYEKSPVMKMNAAWIAQEDGVIDPFFVHFAYTYIGNRIELPGISFEEFINNEYYKNRDKTWNYVSKHFQDCSGWPISSVDYEEIKRMLSTKGYNIESLPSLPKYEPIVGKEAHVTEQLLKPLLNRMGYVYKKDYFTEVEFTAGHGETGYGLDKRPDVCLHMTGSGKNIGAQVVIEMKLSMSNVTLLEKAFIQGLSYAKYGEARIYCLADEAGIYVFQRDKSNKFSLSKRQYYRWEEMSNYDKYIELKRLFEKQ